MTDWTAVIVSVLGLIGVGGIVTLVKIAVQSQSDRAADWKSIAQTSEASVKLNGEHVRDLVGAVNQLATAQRECLAILQTMQAERRGAA